MAKIEMNYPKNIETKTVPISELLKTRGENQHENSTNLKTILSIMYKQLLILSQYKFDIIYWIFMPMLWLVPFFWLGQTLLGSTQSATFKQFTGSSDYLGFLLVGSMLWSTLDSALWGVGNGLRWEQQSGTLEYLWVSPASRTDILTGQSLGEAGWVAINVFGQFILLNAIFKWNVTYLTSIFSILAVIVMFIGMLGFGFLFASIIMIFKEPGVLTELTDMTLFIISPVRYPIQGLPVVIRFIAVVLPFTWGATIIRNLLIAQQSVYSVLLLFVYLIVIDIAFWVIGFRVFRRVERRTRKTGELGTF